MTDEAEERADSRDVTGWLAGRRFSVERWVEQACQKAIGKARGVAADEIRGLSRRVERMHDLLDHLERIVESQADAEEEHDNEEAESVLESE